MTKPNLIPSRAHPLVKELYREMIRRRRTYADIAKESGVAGSTIRDWRSRSIPRVDLLEAALNAVGLRLEIVPMAQPYNAQRDMAASLDAAYAAVRGRVANGGEPWKPR